MIHMIGADKSEDSRSLAHQVSDLEQQLTQRRQRVRSLARGIKRKVTAQMISPGMLVAAVGIGVALEQTSHHKGWSLATVLDAANESFRLLLSFKSSDTAGH
jgi:ribose 5-phosphate isomerase RpiB